MTIIGFPTAMAYGGISLEEINYQLYSLYMYPAHKTSIWRWIMKYTPIANRYIHHFEPQVGNIWYVGETVIRIHGKNYWFWDVIDETTRFLIGTHLSKNRTLKDAT